MTSTTDHVDGLLADQLALLPSALAARLSASPPASRVGLAEDGTRTWTRFRNPRPLTDAGCMSAVHELPDLGRPVLLLGVGDGQRLAWLLAHTDRTVLAWDPDLSIWQALLGQLDLRAYLVSGRLQVLFGPDLLHSDAARSAVRVVHPDFAAAYADAASMLDGTGPVALMVQGELFVDDVARALRDEGFRVFRWDVGHLPHAEHDHILRTSGAALAVAINTHEGLPEALGAHRIPFAVWEIDPNTTGPAPVHGPAVHTAVFSYRAQNLPALRRAGYRHVSHLPLGAPVHRFTQAPSTDPTIPIAFVGASMAESAGRMHSELRALFSDQPATLERLSRVLTIQRQDNRRWQVPALLETIVPGLRARVRQDHAGLDLALLLGEISAAEKRLNWLAPLGPLGLRVWGDPGWALARDHGVAWAGWADHFVDLPRIYADAAIHVDVPRLYQQDAVAMRVFDVLAAGGFLLAEHSAELVALFRPGVELDTYRSPRELADKCRFYLSQPELRRSIAAAGQARVHADHSIRVRVRSIVEHMRTLAG